MSHHYLISLDLEVPQVLAWLFSIMLSVVHFDRGASNSYSAHIFTMLAAWL